MQKSNYVLFFDCSFEKLFLCLKKFKNEIDDELNAIKKIQFFQIWIANVKSHLMTTKKYFKKINVIISNKILIDLISQIDNDKFIEKIHDEMIQTIKNFIHYMKKST